MVINYALFILQFFLYNPQVLSKIQNRANFLASQRDRNIITFLNVSLHWFSFRMFPSIKYYLIKPYLDNI